MQPGATSACQQPFAATKDSGISEIYESPQHRALVTEHFLQNNPEVVDGCSGVIAICKGHHVAELSTEELRAILDKLDEVCRQAQELRKQITERMVARARGDRPVSGAASLKERRSRSHKRA